MMMKLKQEVGKKALNCSGEKGHWPRINLLLGCVEKDFPARSSQVGSSYQVKAVGFSSFKHFTSDAQKPENIQAFGRICKELGETPS